MRKSVMKGFIAIALMSMIVPAAAFSADTIKIGVAGPHTGDLAPYGLPTKDAVTMIAEQVNASGGVLGMQIEVMPMDDQCKPEIATNAATKLVSQGVDIVIGHVCYHTPAR